MRSERGISLFRKWGGLIGWIGIGWAQLGYVEEGEASYYAPSFHGRRTASGERYDRQALTGAHRTLPFGTYVRVTDKVSGRSVVVRINDRGPLKTGRIIDLSEKAAAELGILARGIAAVRLEVTQLFEEPPKSPTASLIFFTPDGKAIQPKPYAVQIGAFSELPNAYMLARNAQKEVQEPVFLWQSAIRSKKLYRVVVGGFSSSKEAESLRDRLKREGWQAFVVHLPT
ncbi:MAG: septal ring lytic transglycosylase RlpA family protein [Bacteroidia bacterium]|nr:septal ring lytic transglycosylase RlpA family protein [Bacteroidia bacterium]